MYLDEAIREAGNNGEKFIILEGWEGHDPVFGRRIVHQIKYIY